MPSVTSVNRIQVTIICKSCALKIEPSDTPLPSTSLHTYHNMARRMRAQFCKNTAWDVFPLGLRQLLIRTFLDQSLSGHIELQSDDDPYIQIFLLWLAFGNGECSAPFRKAVAELTAEREQVRTTYKAKEECALAQVSAPFTAEHKRGGSCVYCAPRADWGRLDRAVIMVSSFTC